MMILFPNRPSLVLFFKAHVSAYTRKDGTFVTQHQDSRPDMQGRPGASNGRPKKLKTLEQLKKLIGESEAPIFVRWSRGHSLDSRQKNSRDYLQGGQHIGLSAVEIDKDWISDDKWLARRILEYRFLKMKDDGITAHIYSGDETGKDSDGYALIENTKPIATLGDDLIQKLRIIRDAA